MRSKKNVRDAPYTSIFPPTGSEQSRGHRGRSEAVGQELAPVGVFPDFRSRGMPNPRTFPFSGGKSAMLSVSETVEALSRTGSPLTNRDLLRRHACAAAAATQSRPLPNSSSHERSGQSQSSLGLEGSPARCFYVVQRGELYPASSHIRRLFRRVVRHGASKMQGKD